MDEQISKGLADSRSTRRRPTRRLVLTERPQVVSTAAPETDDQPWRKLHDLVESGTPEEVQAYLAALPMGEVTLAVSRLSDDDKCSLLQRAAPGNAAAILEHLPEAEAADMLELLPPEAAAEVVHELPSDERADLLSEVEEDRAEAIIEALDPSEAAEVRFLSEYAPDCAGGLMVTELLSFRGGMTVAEVLDDLRQNALEYSDYDVQYAYVVNRDDQLQGVLRMRDLILAPGDLEIRELMIRDPLVVRGDATLDALRDVFDRHGFLAMPVLSQDDHLLGIVQRTAVEEALADRVDADYLKAQGIIGGEELRSFPVLLRSRRRLSWLSVNILLNVVAASVIAAYQDTLAQVIALAVFLPIISDMSGCSGNQAVAVSMRELSLGLVRPKELLRVLWKELAVGAINGIALGVLIAIVATIWKGNPWLGLVVGVAMTLNTLLAVSIGGTVPLLLRGLGKDPALASGPILTTITDMCGFFLVLSLAAALMPMLT